LSFGLETNSNIAEINGTIFNLYSKKFDLNERLKKIERVTKEDVNKFAKKVANEKQFVVVAVGKGLCLSDIEAF
jgi:predicted Zn-dependent peptidase